MPTDSAELRAALGELMHVLAAGPESIDDALASVLHAAQGPQAPDADAAPGASAFDRVAPLPADFALPVAVGDGRNPGEVISALSPLELAVATQNVAAVRQLVRVGCGVDFVGGYACTCLCKCCYAFPDNAEMARLLLAAGANPDATTNNDTNSASCLIISVVKGNTPVVRALLEYGADAMYEWRGSNALAMALDFKKHDIAELFETHEFRKAQARRWERFQDRQKSANGPRSPSPEAAPTRPPARQGSRGNPQPAAPAAPAASPAPVQGDPLAGLSGRLEEAGALIDPADVEVQGHISAGAHGEVHRGLILSTGDTCATKHFACSDVRGQECFRQEVELLARFRHENIVLFRGAVVSPGRHLAVTELCPGTLYDRLQSTNPLPWPLRLRWARDVARGMTYLHAQRPPVVHRDLKSLNVLVDGAGVAKLCDFGIARLREDTFVLTQHIAGSPAWMAPEVLRGDDFSEPSDVYAFGVVLWELAVRQVPWYGKTMAQLVGLIGFGNGQLPLPEPSTGAPQSFRDAIAKCFRPAFERPTFRELRDVLDTLAATDLD